jgi:hypothetical protein
MDSSLKKKALIVMFILMSIMLLMIPVLILIIGGLVFLMSKMIRIPFFLRPFVWLGKKILPIPCKS